jgi:hypothetical protein
MNIDFSTSIGEALEKDYKEGRQQPSTNENLHDLIGSPEYVSLDSAVIGEDYHKGSDTIDEEGIVLIDLEAYVAAQKQSETLLFFGQSSVFQGKIPVHLFLLFISHSVAFLSSFSSIYLAVLSMNVAEAKSGRLLLGEEIKEILKENMIEFLSKTRFQTDLIAMNGDGLGNTYYCCCSFSCDPAALSGPFSFSICKGEYSVVCRIAEKDPTIIQDSDISPSEHEIIIAESLLTPSLPGQIHYYGDPFLLITG